MVRTLRDWALTGKQRNFFKGAYIILNRLRNLPAKMTRKAKSNSLGLDVLSPTSACSAASLLALSSDCKTLLIKAINCST